MRTYAHANPFWNHHYDCVIRVALQDDDELDEYEFLPAKLVSKGVAKIYCIPFFVYGLALGDVVSIDEEFNYLATLTPSGRATNRIAFHSGNVHDQIEFLQEIVALGGFVERATDSLVAIDCMNTVVQEGVWRYLEFLVGSNLVEAIESGM